MLSAERTGPVQVMAAIGSRGTVWHRTARGDDQEELAAVVPSIKRDTNARATRQFRG